MRKFEHIERTVVVAVAVLFTVAVVVAFARQPRPDLVADAIAATPPAPVIYAGSPEGGILWIGDSYTLPAFLIGDKVALPGQPISEIRKAVELLPVKRYREARIVAGIANITLGASLSDTRLELRELARYTERKFSCPTILYDPNAMLEFCKFPKYSADGFHLNEVGYLALFSGPSDLWF